MRTIVIAVFLAFACGSSPAPRPVDKTEPPAAEGAPYAIALVYCGWELWNGNDKEVPEIGEDDVSRYPGVLLPIRESLARSNFPDAPAGALGMLVTYSDKPVVRVPMGPIARLDAKAFGTQKDYYKSTGHELVAAIRVAHDGLRGVKARRRALVIVGDGNDTNDEAAKPALRELRTQAAAEGIEVVSIVYKAQLSSEGDVTAALTDNVKRVRTGDMIAMELQQTLEELGGKVTPVDPSVRVSYALAVVMNGWEVWLGNDKEIPSIKPSDPDRFEGTLLGMRDALGKSSFPKSAPADARGTLIVYADKPMVRVPMGPIAKLDAKSLGTQQDYYGTTGVELVAALRLAAGEVKKVNAQKRYIVVLGDGNDTNNEDAKVQLMKLREQFKTDGVEVFSLVYKARLSLETEMTHFLTPNVKTFASADALGTELARTLERLK